MNEQDWNMDRPISKAPPRFRQRVYRVLAALIGGTGIVFAVASGTAFLSSSRAIDGESVWIDTVERGSLVWEVAAAGSLHPANTRLISAPVAGSVIEKHREVGDELQPGTPIVTLDNVTERRRLLEIEQDLRVARAALSELQRDLQSRELEQQKDHQEMVFELRDARRRAEASAALPKGAMPKIEVLRLAERVEALETLLEVEERRAEADAGSAVSRIEQQQVRIEQLEKLTEFQQQIVDSLSIRSAAPGVLKNLPIETGAWVTEGAVLAEIVEPGELVARLRVPESAAASLRLGLPARLNARGIELTGRVKRIDPAVTSGTITVDVELASAPSTLRTDLSIQGFIELDRANDVIHMARPIGVVEHSQVRLQRLIENGRPEHVSVRFGPSAGDRIQVLAGLNEGDRVVLSTSAEQVHETRLVRTQ